MPKLTITRGLPGSGKTTWAKTVLEENPDKVINVNRDDTRERLFKTVNQDYYDTDQDTLRRKEALVTHANQEAAVKALRAGFDVIISDTNLPVKVCRDWRKLAVENGAEFEVKDFSQVSLGTCFERNALRNDKEPVPNHVIQRMFDRFVKGGLAPLPPIEDEPVKIGGYGVEPYKRDISKPSAYIFDIDGTLAQMGDRSPYDFTQVHKDTVKKDVARVSSILDREDWTIIMSGRSEECRQQTEEWLEKNGIEFDELYMRAKGDNRPDWQIKYDLFNEHVRNRYNVRGVFDDRNQVVALWREMGLTCFQVDYGDF